MDAGRRHEIPWSETKYFVTAQQAALPRAILHLFAMPSKSHGGDAEGPDEYLCVQCSALQKGNTELGELPML